MAIVEDEVRNDSEEENEIEVVVEEDDGEQDSDDSDDDDDDEVLEQKVSMLERKISEDPYYYEDHIELIQALWGLSDLDRWRQAFDNLQQLFIIKPEHWLLRLQTEVTISHTEQSRDRLAKLFQDAALDCYSIPIFTEWCTWALSGSVSEARDQMKEVFARAAADPLSGKLFWDARLELEKSQLDAMSEADPEYKAQQDAVLWCLEEAAARPLLRAEGALPQLLEFAAGLKDDDYVEKVQKQHEIAMEYLQKITSYEDKLLTLKDADEKIKVYQEYIDTVKELSQDDKYAECDSNGILKILYDRATTECLASLSSYNMLLAYAQHAEATSSRATYRRILDSCTRRCPRKYKFWMYKMQLAEKEEKDFEQVKAIFESALSKDMVCYKETECLWMSYLEYIRRQTDFEVEAEVERLRGSFRLAWDTLAEAWGEEANDCEVPLYWARIEYRRLKDPKRGKEIFEEIFKYGENKTLGKYWEALIHLETSREPPLSQNKLRDLYKRALKFVKDYPVGVARLWIDYEREYGALQPMKECALACETKIKEWQEYYKAMKEKMSGQKHKGKQQHKQQGKNKFDNKKRDDGPPRKGKRKSDQNDEGSEVKRKKEDATEVKGSDKNKDMAGVKRSHDHEEAESSSSTKRARKDSAGSDGGGGVGGDADGAGEGSGGGGERAAARDACTLFVSNLEFKVEEQKVRDALCKYGDIVSLRVRAGIKAFGGSICYCQYTTPESVEAALKHDRTPLDGRPMFFSRYSAKKSKPTFKYATSAENNKLFVKNLPFSYCTKEKLTEVFGEHGKLKDVRAVTYKDGKPKGLAYIEFEDESSAAAALEKTNGTTLAGRKIEVLLSAPPPRKDLPPGPAQRSSTGPATHMRRTQLSSLIPSSVLRASTSKEAPPSNGAGSAPTTAPAPAPAPHTNGEKRPLSNADFRSMLLK